jgi:hypothetical protein
MGEPVYKRTEDSLAAAAVRKYMERALFLLAEVTLSM